MQSRISSFFGAGAAGAKRSAPSATTSPPKRQKPSSETGSDGAASSEGASAKRDVPADVQSRIAANRATALARLAERRAASAAPSMPPLEPSWRKALAVTLAEPFWPQLAKFVESRRSAATVYPPPDAVFSAFNHAPLQRVKVVIIGQDPYHGPRQAHGMCFSVEKGVTVPPSLRNMYKELASDIEGWTAPRHGNLEDWAKQGVLLLNNVLTVEAGKPNSHKGRGWERFTDAVVSAINKREGKGCVFLLWGNFAKTKCANINRSKHKILYAPHPSPFSADRGFFGCKHFSKANEYLRSTGQTPIDWNLPNV